MTEFNKDHYRTPLYFSKWIQIKWHCTIDGASFFRNKVCGHFIGPLVLEGDEIEDERQEALNIATDFLLDGLPEKLSNWGSGAHSIFVNPPYSDPIPFVKRAAELMAQGHLVVMLLPADKSTKWYKVIQENATEVIDIIGGRINFLHPVTGQEVKGNNKGSMVAVFDPFMQGFITRQVELDFVKKVGGYYGGQ